MDVLGQALITASLSTTTDLGQQAKAIVLSHMSQKTLNISYKTPGNVHLTGWDIILRIKDEDILIHALSMAEETRLNATMPDLDPICAEHTFRLWIALKGATWSSGVLGMLRNNTLQGSGAVTIAHLILDNNPTPEMIERLALWRLQNNHSTELCRAIDDGIKANLDDETATFLAKSLIVDRRLPQAITWLAILGQGKGFHISLRQGIKINALYERALEKLTSAHGRVDLLARLGKLKSHKLRSGKALNTALKNALDPS